MSNESTSSNQDELTPLQRAKISECYRMIAELLPVEGKDYTVSFSFNTPLSGPNLTIKGKTDIGNLWSDYLYKHLGKGNR